MPSESRARATAPTIGELARLLLIDAKFLDVVAGGADYAGNAARRDRFAFIAQNMREAADQLSAQAVSIRKAFREGFYAGANMAGTLSEEECWSDSDTQRALAAVPAPPDTTHEHER